MDDYEKIKSKVQDEIKNYLNSYADKNQFNLSKIPVHSHNGMDVQQINPENLLGFRIDTVANASIAPTDTSQNGKVRFLVDKNGGVAHWYLWVRLPNVLTGVNGWNYVKLT